MTKTLHATFDGEVLRPEGPVDLEVNGHYVLTVNPVPEPPPAEDTDVTRDPAYDIASLAVHTGIPDLASEHDHYLYGTPKRNQTNDN